MANEQYFHQQLKLSELTVLSYTAEFEHENEAQSHNKLIF